MLFKSRNKLFDDSLNPHRVADIATAAIIEKEAKSEAAPSPSPSDTWIADDGVNYFNSCSVDGKTWVELGKLDSKEACQQACAAKDGCQAWTWHDADQGSWAKKCVGRTDGFYGDKREGGHYSGRRDSTYLSPSCTNGPTVQLASVALLPSQGGLLV